MKRHMEQKRPGRIEKCYGDVGLWWMVWKMAFGFGCGRIAVLAEVFEYEKMVDR